MIFGRNALEFAVKTVASHMKESPISCENREFIEVKQIALADHQNACRLLQNSTAKNLQKNL